ncbi:hypothetical protein VSDG_01455 [Cytospora chrysosperma]|uniref:Uncharacterized protein n=1 Tax=Cytospora chrysosperma TaxID=252740 RepID=A0A423WIX2_CYTCH|nr:hypothetical protein VSDG_01455 [Valsa sordida]
MAQTGQGFASTIATAATKADTVEVGYWGIRWVVNAASSGWKLEFDVEFRSIFQRNFGAICLPH